MTHLHLHGGQKKTGTTALQAFLERHHSVIADRGMDVAIPARGAVGHHALLSELGSPMDTDNARDFRRQFGVSLIPEFAAQVAHGRGRPIILSSEVMAKRAFTGDAPAMFAMLFAAGITTIDLHIFVRASLAYLNSDYSQVTKTLKVNGLTFEQYADATALDNVAILTRLADLSAIPGVAVRFHPYTASVVAHGTARFFCHLIGLDMNDLPAEPRLNPAIGPICLEAIRQIGARLRPDAPFEQKRRTAQGMLAVAAQLGEDEAWLIDRAVEQRHAGALLAMDGFTRRVWGMGWRDVFGEDDRRCNRFLPTEANAADLATFEACLATFADIAHREDVL